MSILRNTSRFVVHCWGIALALALVPACNFKPRIPDAVLTCAADQHCPEGFYCQVGLGRCCRHGACDEVSGSGGAGPAPSRPGPGSGSGGAGAPAVDAGSTDASVALEPAVPPMASSDAAVDTGASELASDAATAVNCSGTMAVPADEPGRERFCTIVARANDIGLSIHSMLPNDAASTRTYGVCYGSLPLAQETSDPSTKTGRPLSAASLDALIGFAEQFKKTCGEHKARIVGAAAYQWARQATNWPEIQQKFRTSIGIELELPSPSEEMAQLYFGVTRNRRGRVLFMPNALYPEIIYWTKGAPLMTRLPLKLSWGDVNDMYMGNAAHATFEDARHALRGRLDSDLGPQLATLEQLVRDKTLDAGFVVGPTDATVPLALAGELRDSLGSWFSATAFRKKRDEAAVTPSPYGRIFGPAPFTAIQVDAFFETLTPAQWGQLRGDAIRSAYGGELLYVTTVLDLLADEAKAIEFAFVFANHQLGLLFAKLLPPPT